jgi:hypothetical protein
VPATEAVGFHRDLGCGLPHQAKNRIFGDASDDEMRHQIRGLTPHMQRYILEL